MVNLSLFGYVPMANLFYAFWTSDPVGQVIVIGLLLASIVVWTIMVNKWRELRAAETADERFMREFNKQRHPLEMYVQGEKVRHVKSPLYHIYFNACQSLKHELEMDAQKKNLSIAEIDLSVQRLTPLQIEAVRKSSECAGADQTLLMESQMAFLGSAYTIAPLLGLFGTVWGVMLAFSAMGEQGMANLSAVAPGIASALLTTVAGLFVAIPTALITNYLNDKIRFLCVQMENFTDKYITKLQQVFIDNE